MWRAASASLMLGQYILSRFVNQPFGRGWEPTSISWAEDHTHISDVFISEEALVLMRLSSWYQFTSLLFYYRLSKASLLGVPFARAVSTVLMSTCTWCPGCVVLTYNRMTALDPLGLEWVLTTCPLPPGRHCRWVKSWPGAPPFIST